MNKKIFCGMITCGIAAGFWACGSGDIAKPTSDDELVSQMVANPTEKSFVNVAGLTEADCPECFVGVAKSSSSAPKPKSSSSSANPGTQTSSSSNGGNGGVIIKSSSSRAPLDLSSSSGGGTGPTQSSSSVPVKPGNKTGSCAPTTAISELDTDVTWKYTRGESVLPNQLLEASYTWTFKDAVTPTVSVTGAAGVSQTVQYKKSGDHGATLALSIGASVYEIECSPVHINGAAIKGCTCAPEGVTGAVNYLKTPDVVWKVSGCSTGAGLTLSYAWDGGVAGAETSFTKTFTAATTSAAPTLVVANDDNSLLEVACSPVKVTEGEEFTIKTSQDKVVFTESGSFAISANLPEGWHNTDTQCNVYCQAQSPNFTVTIDEIELSGKVSGQNYVTKGGMPVAHTVGGYTIPVTVEIAAGDTVTCGVNW